MSRLLIVGGSGFIGNNLANAAYREGFKITVLTKLGLAKESNIADVEVIKSDLLDPDHLRSVLKGKKFKFIVNLSGYIDHTPFFQGGESILKVHFLGLVNLLNSIEREDLKSFIHIGSSDEYGNQPAPQIETMRESPISPYSSAKVASTHLLQSLYKTEGFPATMLRLFLVYGVGQKKDRFIPQIIEGCLSNSAFATSEGKQVRDFTYVDDISKGILKALRSDEVLGEVINLASGNPLTVRSLISLIQKKVGSGSPNFGSIPYRTSENMKLVANIDKAQELLKWKPEIGIDEGLDLIIKDYQGR